MAFYRSNSDTPSRRSRPVVSAFSLAWLCLQGAFGLAVVQAVAQNKDASGSDTESSSQSTATVAARLSAQNTLFKEQFEDDLKLSPESETARGDYWDNAT